MEKVVIWGASGHARVIADIIRLQNQYKIYGFLDDINLDRKGSKFCGETVIGGIDQLDHLLDQNVNRLIFGFGNIEVRKCLAEIVTSKGFQFITVVHPSAVIASDVTIGSGTMIAAGAIICPGARVGCHSIINTCSSIDHDCKVGDYVHISVNVHLAGRVVVEDHVLAGIGTTIIDGLHIGTGSVIGAGSVVIHDLPPFSLSYGVPARVVRNLKEHEVG